MYLTEFLMKCIYTQRTRSPHEPKIQFKLTNVREVGRVTFGFKTPKLTVRNPIGKTTERLFQRKIVIMEKLSPKAAGFALSENSLTSDHRCKQIGKQ